MSGGPGLEQRYRRVLRLLPGYYRQRWEQDMVAAFLDSWHSLMVFARAQTATPAPPYLGTIAA